MLSLDSCLLNKFKIWFMKAWGFTMLSLRVELKNSCLLNSCPNQPSYDSMIPSLRVEHKMSCCLLNGCSNVLNYESKILYHAFIRPLGYETCALTDWNGKAWEFKDTHAKGRERFGYRFRCQIWSMRPKNITFSCNKYENESWLLMLQNFTKTREGQGCLSR